LVEHLHGKEGVSGSSPEEGLKPPTEVFVVRADRIEHLPARADPAFDA